MFLADDIPDLKIQRTAGKLISLVQTDGEEGARIDIHPIHVRYIAEQFGLVPTGDVEAAKAIAALQRRLLALRDRVRRQSEMLRDIEGTVEQAAYADATMAIADEYCADIEGRG